MKSNVSIYVAINSYLLRCSMGALLVEEYGNIIILDKITSEQELISILDNTTGCIIMEEELIKLIPREYKLHGLVDLVILASSLSKSNFNGLAKETIIYSDLRGQIVKKIEAVISPKQTENHQDNTLSDREIEVVKMVAKGYINKEIADLLHISIHTVITHRKNITNKLGIKTISGLSIYAFLNGIIQSDEAKL